MELPTRKSFKMTTGLQFSQLVSCMEQYPHLATGTPQFGSSKSAMENTWDTVASKVNAYGPPLRNGSEWKKVWIDLRGRLKKKIAENAKSLHETGGGPYRVTNLTELESDIDRICHISAAAAPSGYYCGIPTKKPESGKTLIDFTPPSRSQNVVVITPTSSIAKKEVVENETFPGMATSTPKPTAQRKRKHCDNGAVSEGQERIKLLRQQCETHSQTLEAIKLQAESSKEVAAAVKECTEAIKTQSDTLLAISNSLKLMTKSIVDILWHVTEK